MRKRKHGVVRSVPPHGGRLEIVTAERQEQVAQRVHGRGAPEAGAEDGIQALALEGDKGADLLVGGRACACGEDREQQQITHAVALALRAARIGHFGECGKQGSKWHRGDLYKAGRSPLWIRYLRPTAAHAQVGGSGRYSRTEWPCLTRCSSARISSGALMPSMAISR